MWPTAATIPGAATTETAFISPPQGKDLVYGGKVDHGFDKASAADLRMRCPNNGETARQ
jgi:hypothetical protein